MSKRPDIVAIMLIEDQRFIHEDLERLEQGIADRVAEEPRNVSIALSVMRLPLLNGELDRIATV